MPAGQTPKQTPKKGQKSGILVPARARRSCSSPGAGVNYANSNGGFPRLSVPAHPELRIPGAQEVPVASLMRTLKVIHKNFVRGVVIDVIRCYIIIRNRTKEIIWYYQKIVTMCYVTY